ncbi:rhodanese-like domain-containing protein [Laspinema olomoucense]|uniref:Rhodanese-like domain-containing protein n=1 Tax=Laspinema olomoucense D3b TaxID=2953688 RepID=A0ABT2NFP5_9CYAN|nr:MULTISPECIES: rhodanese-like domain-containing protein [unclassified Laspinema]MCT7971799.1 rhodanese-like domain-containing protein [Laspinema sp. D3d]MCT7981521.1 rhodanese-like domain-containing protein [Laspinema sp. D3b]MCT7989123.1 rhodanese-like domain-containing protein [Laspinema sp. D3a]MCT7993403.1 rhodanese-like domain-containing protein [Laspinema sp. D3c]
MANLADNIEHIKESLPNITPTPPDLKPQVTPAELKSRLEWGEPGLTIIDVRERESFNYERITGAVAMPMEMLADTASSSLEFKRDIYLYGDTDEQTKQAASELRSRGFMNVAEIKGSLPAWKAIGGPTEGIASMEGPSGPSSVKKSESNVAARVGKQGDLEAKKAQQHR